MAKVLITESTLEDIADAIRAKANTNRTYKPSEMAIAIHSLGDEHQPAHINIAQTDNQTITVNANLFSTSEVQTEHTTNFTVNVPNSVQLNASVVPDTGYAAGALNIANTVLSWGNTANFNAVAPTRLSPTVTYNVLSAQPVSLGNVNVKYIFTGPSVAEIYNLTDNRTISVPTLNNNETCEKVVSYYVTEADILEGSIDISITNSTSEVTTSITLETEEPTSQLTVTRNGASNNSIIVTNTGNLTLYGISIDCTNDGNSIQYASIAPGENQIITLDNLTYTFETVSIEATSPDPDNPDYTLEQTIYFDPTLLNIRNYKRHINNSEQITSLPVNNVLELTNRIIDSDASTAFQGCRQLTSLSNVQTTWIMSNVTDTPQMFDTCTSLTSIDLSSWDTSSLQDAHQMFNTCGITSLDLSDWDTSSLQYAHQMFYECRALTLINVSNWDTSNLQDAHQMFAGCRSLTSIDLSGWNTSNLTNVQFMFQSCYSLIAIDFSNWDTSNFSVATKVVSQNCLFYPNSTTSTGSETLNNLSYIIISDTSFNQFFRNTLDFDNFIWTAPNVNILVPSNLVDTYKNTYYNALYPDHVNAFKPIENYTVTKSNGQVTVTPNS